MLGIDGCFLKGAIKGEVLATVMKDRNDQMFPMAWAMVDCERKAIWEWFLELLKNDLGLGNGSG